MYLERVSIDQSSLTTFHSLVTYPLYYQISQKLTKIQKYKNEKYVTSFLRIDEIVPFSVRSCSPDTKLQNWTKFSRFRLREIPGKRRHFQESPR